MFLYVYKSWLISDEFGLACVILSRPSDETSKQLLETPTEFPETTAISPRERHLHFSPLTIIPACQVLRLSKLEPTLVLFPTFRRVFDLSSKLLYAEALGVIFFFYSRLDMTKFYRQSCKKK